MIARLILTIADRDGNEASTSRYIPVAVSFASLVGAAQAFETVVSGITNGRIVRGSVHVELFRRTQTAVSQDSNIRRSLVIVTRAAQQYAITTIPSASLSLPCYEQVPAGSPFAIRATLAGSVAPCLQPFATLDSGTIIDEFGRVLSIEEIGAVQVVT